MGLLRGSSMDRSEPALVPEWLRQNHHSSNAFQSGLTRNSSFSNRAHHPPFVFGERVAERESSSNRSYPNFGRGRFERSERDREVPVISRGGHEWDWSRERRAYDGGERPQGSFGDGGRFKAHSSPSNNNNSHRLPPPRLEVGPAVEKKLPSWPSNGSYDRKLGLRSAPLPGRSSSLVVPGESESVESHSPSPTPSPSCAPAPKMSEALINFSQSQTVSENQRLEEIALKQSRQLIPMKPALPKTMGASREKFKQQVKTVTTIETKVSSVVAPYRGSAPAASSTNGTKQLLVLKSRNSASSQAGAGGGGGVASPVGNGSGAGNANANANGNGNGNAKQGVGRAREEERKVAVLSQNRSDFFNAIRRKAAANGESRSCQENENEGMNRRRGEGEEEERSSAKAGGGEMMMMMKPAESNGHHHQLKAQFTPASVGSEEEEMIFLKSLGWVESPEGEDEALTTEEINSFFQKHPSALNQMLRNLSGSSLGSPSSSGSDSDDESRAQSA